MDKVIELIVIPVAVGFILAFAGWLAARNDFADVIRDLKRQEDLEDNEGKKKRIRIDRIAYQRKSVVNYIIRVIAICIMAGVAVFGISVMYLMEAFKNDKIKIYTLKFGFIYNWLFILLIIIFLIIMVVIIFRQVSEEKKYISHALVSAITICLAFFWLGAFLLDKNYSVDYLSPPQITAPEGVAVENQTILRWNRIDTAYLYVVSVNGKTYLTDETELKLKKLIPMKTNVIIVTAWGYGSNPAESEELELFCLPEIQDVKIDTGRIGDEITAWLYLNNRDGEDWSSVYEYAGYTWFRNDIPIDTDAKWQYVLSPEDYNNEISVSVALGTSIITSNAVKPLAGAFPLPEISVSSDENYILVQWYGPVGAQWYNFYVDGKLVVKTYYNYVSIKKDTIKEDSKCVVEFIGEGFTDTRGYIDFSANVLIKEDLPSAKPDKDAKGKYYKFFPLGTINLYFVIIGWAGIAFLIVFSNYVRNEDISYCLDINVISAVILVGLYFIADNVYNFWLFLLSPVALICLADGIACCIDNKAENSVAPFTASAVLLISDIIYIAIYQGSFGF